MRDAFAVAQPTRSSARRHPEALKKKKIQKAIVEDGSSDEETYNRGPPIMAKKAPMALSKEVRFENPVEKAKLPDRPYVLVPPLRTQPLAPFQPVGETSSRESNDGPGILPNLEKRAPAYKNKAPIEDDEAITRIIEELVNTRFTTSLKDLAGVSAPAREYLRKMMTRKKVPTEPGRMSNLEYNLVSLVDLMSQKQQQNVLHMCNLLAEESGEVEKQIDPEQDPVSNVEKKLPSYIRVEDLPPADSYVADGVPNVPDGSMIFADPVLQYYNSLAEGEEPKPIRVASESQALRTVYPLIHKSGRAEVLLDTGSQICSMDSDVARDLGITFDPDVVIHLQSANGTTDKTLGLARNVEFDFDGVMAYIQLHIIRKPAYSVLLGRPFDVTMRSEVINTSDGNQTLTLRDPNTGKRATIPTFAKGKPPTHIQKALWDQKDKNFRDSRI